MVHDNDGKLGLWMTLCLSIGGMIGAGIFMLPVALAQFGANAVAGWLVSSAGALCIAFALSRLTRSGSAEGIQAYIERAFGPTGCGGRRALGRGVVHVGDGVNRRVGIFF